MKKVSQLTLSVQLPDDETFASFKSESNQMVVQQLTHFLDHIGDENKQVHSLFLFGLTDVGKSHLLHASCAYADTLGITSLCLSFSELTQLSVDVLDGLENIDLVCLDDIQLIAGNNIWQQGVFDLYNRMVEQNKCLIITGDQSAAQLNITLPDLVSRLSWGLTEQLKPLSDKEKSFALQYRAQQRGLTMNDDVARFLINRLSRDMTSLIAALEQLDQASIREQRRITIPFIKDVLF
ncbi:MULTISPECIES: DnaA regulatory inactivator Hda [unclassified Colwellia]|uniref:DnaA regulatory inactivator Hda n=1 Tax=unclassified Colwellia TaxID=196834 RepID=UPI0015F5D3E3|nr:MULTISPECIES: DnaA regulatory inactivator Hda [unclassified Colwellia]MBA6225349.1 DnaA regulatory inactivator Hda [Colwellia sp. MB3u-45]MBA6267201.1 DnaA regulatory inactivator Hda [Colwellia sp. MB3u-43]MBA6289981.1 DnaA regulatory inactivator Hda [Colwellia sp. MB3u-4]MBA6297138.1 DnaA regulatory inactivator Hda [Colwellia sp. MB02u-9]MBA6322813.1 DnaA regulatory inactivator Hda [Colwellia sp. MB02u-19]